MAGRSYLMSKARDSSHKVLPHDQCQGWWPRRATPRPRSGGCVGEGGPRGATLCSKSGGAVVKR